MITGRSRRVSLIDFRARRCYSVDVAARPFRPFRVESRILASALLGCSIFVASVSEAQEAKVASPDAPQKVGDKRPVDFATGKPLPPWETTKAERRSGFAMGLSLGTGLGASNGYPNDAKKIGRKAYYTESGLGLGTASSVWLGGALADWINFGLGFGYSNIFSKGASSPAPLAFFHTDLYPLYSLKGTLRDLGTTFDFGLGFPKTITTKTQVTVIDGAGSSFVYAGVFWEPLRVWRIRLGPTVGAHYLFSQSVRRPLALVGLRLTLYTGP